MELNKPPGLEFKRVEMDSDGLGRARRYRGCRGAAAGGIMGAVDPGTCPGPPILSGHTTRGMAAHGPGLGRLRGLRGARGGL